MRGFSDRIGNQLCREPEPACAAGLDTIFSSTRSRTRPAIVAASPSAERAWSKGAEWSHRRSQLLRFLSGRNTTKPTVAYSEVTSSIGYGEFFKYAAGLESSYVYQCSLACSPEANPSSSTSAARS